MLIEETGKLDQGLPHTQAAHGSAGAHVQMPASTFHYPNSTGGWHSTHTSSVSLAGPAVGSHGDPHLPGEQMGSKVELGG